MKIHDTKNKMQFKNIMYGSIFYHDNCYFMKTQNVMAMDATNGKRNAVELETGTMYFFADNDYVHSLDGHVEIY